MTYEELGGGESLLLLVDGLSEVETKTADLVLDAVDQWAALGPATGTIVADRLVRRKVGPPRWQLATLGGVTTEAVERMLERTVDATEQGLLSSPMYLKVMLELAGSRLGSRSEAISRVLENASITQDDRGKLESLALKVYAVQKRRSFPLSWLEEAVTPARADLLIRSDIITVIDDGQVSFRHHLIHDYLASLAASRDPKIWGQDLFNALSLHSSSNDALVMLLEQVQGELRNVLIRSVYDWNLYAASYLLSRDRQVHGDTDASTEHEILALLGERRFDHYLATRRQVEDALVLHGGEVANAYLDADSLDEVLALAKSSLQNDAKYTAWLHTFLCEERPSPQGLISTLKLADGVEGWTAANVIRRLGLDASGRDQIVELAMSPVSVLRWRAVHALGVAGEGALETLFDRLANDEQSSVQYGALRSIVDQAYLSPRPAERASILRELAGHATLILNTRSLARELARILEVHAPPDDWSESVSPVLEAMLAVEQDTDELDRWRTVGSLLRLRGTKNDQAV